METASKNKRFLNLIIDIICIYITLIIIGDLWYWLYLVPFIYYIFFESFLNKTPGKFLTRTKVIMEDGVKPGIFNVGVRTLCRLIPFEAFTFLGNKNPIGWHDKFSKTRVVDDFA